MTTEPFIQPRFVGQRFEQHTLPLSAAKDLAAYEELVLELAKHLFKQKNEGRVRVPKGFVSDISLHLEKIEDGSARPFLVAVIAGTQLLCALPPEIGEAKELINQVIATEEGQPLPPAFPKDFYSYFNRIGCSLKEGEEIEWAPASPVNKAILTPEKRIRLVRAHRETYNAKAEVIGSIEELDAKKKTGVIRAVQGEGIPFAFDDPFFADFKEALGSPNLYVKVKGVGEFDVNDKLGSIREIEQIDALPHYKLISAIEELSALKNGWLEGGGIAPTSDYLNWLGNEVTKVFPETMEYPSVVPSEEGAVIFEWIRPHARVELEVNYADSKLELYSTNLKQDSFVEKVFQITEWEKAFGEIQSLLLS